MKTTDWKKSMATYLLLKGKWGTYKEELKDLRDYSGQPYILCQEVIRELETSGKVKLRSLGLWQQLNTSYKHSYDLYKRVDLDSAITDLWSMKKKTDMPLYNLYTGEKGMEMFKNTIKVNADSGKYTYELPSASR
jgi:hypothetical protein